MSRLPLTQPDKLPFYLRELHDGAAEDDWSTRHVARAFAPAPDLLETYLTSLYYPWHTNTGDASGVARLTPRLKELVRLRIATLNGCETCKAARLAADTIPEEQALNIDGYAGSDDYSPSERAAVRFAELLAVRHFDIDDHEIVLLREPPSTTRRSSS